MGRDEKLPDYEYSKVSTQPIVPDLPSIIRVSTLMYNILILFFFVPEKKEIPHYGWGVRHIQMLICFFCIMVNFIGRGHMGVTVVSMTSHTKGETADLDTNLTEYINHTNVQGVADKNMTIEDSYGDLSANKSIDGAALVNTVDFFHKTFDWAKSTQEMVLGSFFLGYCIMTFPMGLIVQRWGGKIALQISLFVNGVVSILAPWLIHWGDWKAVCAVRIAQGLSQAGVFPGCQILLAKWVPVSERGTLLSYVYAGSTLGTVIGFQLSGFLCDSRWGWPSTFWAVGLICLGLFAILTIFGTASPSVHKTISEEEKTYILGRIDDGNTKRLKIPWKAILSSKPVWGALATHVGCGASFVFFFTQVPSYIHYILGVNVRGSGFLSSLPYVVSFFTSLFFGIFSDFLTNRKILSVKNARRLFNSISQVGVAVALVCTTFATSTSLAVFCLVFSMGCHLAMHVGWMVNHIDLAPNFGGTLMMMGNTLMNIINVLLPVLVSYVVTDVYNQTQWRTIFLLVAGMAISTNALFVILMSADLQPWNEGLQKDIEDTESKKENETNAKL